MKTKPTETEEWFALAIQCYGQARYRQGRHAHQQVKRQAPGGFHDSMLDGMQLFLDDRFEEALASYEHALAARSSDALAHAHRGVVLMCLHRDEEALDVLEQALRLDPGHEVALTQMGNVYLFLGRYEEALALAEQVLAKDPSAALPALRVKTTALYNLSRLEESLAAAEQVIGLAPGKVFGYAAKADALEQLGRLDDALAAYERALRSALDNAVLWTRMAGVLLRKGFAGDALVAYERALRIEGEDLASHNGRGVALMELGRLTEALEAFDRALLLHPGNQDLLSNRELVLEAMRAPAGQAGAENHSRGWWASRRWAWAPLDGAFGAMGGAASRFRQAFALIGWVGVGAGAVGIGLILLFHPDLRPLLAVMLHPLEIAALPLYPLACWFGWAHRRKGGFNPRVLRPSSVSGRPPRYVWRAGADVLWLRLTRGNLVGALYLLVYASLLQAKADHLTALAMGAENLLFLLHALILVLTGFLFCIWPIVTGAWHSLARLSTPVAHRRLRHRGQRENRSKKGEPAEQERQ
jgi:tetratricopeptide (TPR) repeat protein